jgi:replication initiation protein RepC
MANTGFRRMTPGLLRADRAAESFTGLPEGVTSPGQLLATLKAAAPRLGLSARLVHALDWLFGLSAPQDWETDARPIVWPSARLQQEALGLSPSQVKAVNRRLIELGLLTAKDSPSGKRWGKRDAKGRITEAYGFDLAPLAARHAEFQRLAEQARAERAAMGRLRRRATIARKAIVQILETARDYGGAGEEWRTLAGETEALARALKRVERVDEMAAGVESLERRQQAARVRLEALLAVETAPEPSENRPHQHNYNRAANPPDTVMAAERCSAPRPPPTHDDQGRRHGIAAAEVPRLAPRLKPFLRCPSPGWADIVDAADWLRCELGVAKPLWGEACHVIGREGAALALAIVSTKEPGHFRTTAGGYFHGMVARAKTGELHLERSLWALRRGVPGARENPF